MGCMGWGGPSGGMTPGFAMYTLQCGKAQSNRMKKQLHISLTNAPKADHAKSRVPANAANRENLFSTALTNPTTVPYDSH